MPELPEVETTARGLRARIVGLGVCRVGGVDWPRMLPNASEEDLQHSLVGRRVTLIERRGKYVLIGFDGDRWLIIHRKMSGNVLLRALDAAPELHTHLEIAFDNATLLRFVDARKFGRVYLFGARLAMEDFLSERLGPDSLLELDGDILALKLRGRRGRIKPLLLDQAFMAGVGNLYADEALWEAGLHPLRTADSLSATEIDGLAVAIKHVLEQGIERRGTSFSDYRDADGVPGDNQDFLNVYARSGEPCPRCGNPISRILVGQRSSHVCPTCQPL